MADAGRIDIEGHVDTSKMPEELRRGTRKAADEVEASDLDGFTKATDKVAEKAGTSFSEKFVRDAAGRLHDADTGRFVSEGKKVGNKLGDAVGDGAESSLKKKISGFGNLLAPAWIKTIALWVGIIGPPALQLAAVLAPAVGLIAAIIPAAIGAAASMAILKSAFSGVGQAIKDMNGPADAFNKDLEKLSPNARSFVLEVKKASPVLKALQKDIQNTFFGNIRGDFTSLIKTTLPGIRRGIINISSAFGILGHQIASSFTNTKNISSLNKILFIFGNTIYDVAQGIKPLIHGLLLLAADAVPMLNDGAIVFQKFAFWFDQVITKANRTGKLQEFFVQAEHSLRLIFQIGQDAWTILINILDAASKANGGQGVIDVLTMIASTIKALNENGALTQVFQIFNELFGILGTLLPIILPPLSQLILLLGQTLSDDLVKLAPGLKDLVQNGFVPLLNAAIGLIPVLNPLILAIIKLVNAVASNQTAVQIVFGVLIAWMAAVKAQKIAVEIGAIVESFKAWRTAAASLDVALAANPIGLLVVAIAAVIAGIILLVLYFKQLNDKTDFIGHIGTALKEAALATYHFILDIGKDISDFFTKTIPGYWDSFVHWLSTLPATLGNALLALGKGILFAIGFAIGLWLGALIKLPPFLIGKFFDFLNDLLSLFLIQGPKLIAAVVQWGIGVYNALQNWIISVLIAAGQFGVKFLKVMLNLFLGPVVYATTNFNKIIDQIKALPGRIVALGGKLYSAGLNLITRFFEGLIGKGLDIVKIAKRIVSTVVGALNKGIDVINSGINKAGGVLHIGLPNIPHLAQGAFVTSPTIALIGEKNPEVVLPTDDPKRAAQLLRQSGLEASLSMGTSPNYTWIVKIGERDITDIVSVEVASANEETSMALAHGSRG